MNGLAVVSNEEGLVRPNDDDALFALDRTTLSEPSILSLSLFRQRREGGRSYFSSVQTSRVGFQDDEALPSHVQAITLHGLDVRGVVECVDDLLHLRRGDLFS